MSRNVGHNSRSIKRDEPGLSKKVTLDDIKRIRRLISMGCEREDIHRYFSKYQVDALRKTYDSITMEYYGEGGL